MSTLSRLLIGIVSLLSICNYFCHESYSQNRYSDYEILIDDDRIGLIQDISFGDEHIFIGDLINHKVHSYTRTGSYRKSYGRKGIGPGEFRSIAGIEIGPNDSLYVYDRTERRLVVFPTDSKTNDNGRTTTLSSGPGQLQPNNVGSLISGIEGMWLTSDSRPLVVYNRPVNPMEELDDNRKLELRFGMMSSGKPPVLRIQNRQMLTLNTSKGAMLTVMPFGKKPVIEVDQKRDVVYFGYNDSLIVREKPIGQQARKTVSHEYSRIALSDDILRAKLSRENQDLLDKFSTIREQVPSHVPAFEDFEVDNEGRVWIAVNTQSALEEGHTEYWVFDSRGELLDKVPFDRLIFLKAFSEKHAYGILTKPNGAQQIVKTSLSAILP